VHGPIVSIIYHAILQAALTGIVNTHPEPEVVHPIDFILVTTPRRAAQAGKVICPGRFVSLLHNKGPAKTSTDNIAHGLGGGNH